jgi:hypothetical protein
MVLTAYFVLSPVIGRSCHRRQRIKVCLNPVGPTGLRWLDAGVEASGPHDFAVRSMAVRQRAIRWLTDNYARPAILSRARRQPRPSHPIPRSVTIAIRPLSGRDGEGQGDDLGQMETEIFLKMG